VNIINEEFKKQIKKDIIENFLSGRDADGVANIPLVLDGLYAAIPDNKRISHGRYYTIKILGEYLYTELLSAGTDVFDIGVKIFNQGTEFRTYGVALSVLSFYGLGDVQRILPYFEKAAASEHWEAREFAASFFKKLIREHPVKMRTYLLTLVMSEDSNIRRFVSETLRPVVDNRWLNDDPQYSLGILRHLFRESVAYPRTSVGNNLSDLARRNPDLIYTIVGELVAMEDKHAYWIAHRACRNLVKKEPEKVMGLLSVDEYRYKGRVHRRKDVT
jgi:3-methyladenine DNA glycosylase AlkC